MFAKARFAVEDLVPELIEIALLSLFLRWGLDVGGFVNGIELAALDRVEKDFCGFLDTFEEGIVFGGAGCGLLVGVVAEDLFAVGALDLGFGSPPAVFREAEDCVVVLSLLSVRACSQGCKHNSAQLSLHDEQIVRDDTYFPVFGIPRKHHRIFGLADLAITLISLLELLLGLNLFIFGECSSMSQLQTSYQQLAFRI